tara:strand:- start:106 stop:1518 length:1413 start_codon:yes stop_codon:yes gene_type:complete
LKKIAIIGGGAAGSVAAWALHKNHDVTLFEAESYLGGHAYTHVIANEGKQVSIDMGVEYFHERLSPNLSAILEHFNIGSYIAPLSFKAFNQNNPNLIYWSNCQLGGDLGNSLHDEMNRFQLDMINIMQKDNPALKGMSVQQFLDQENYSENFRLQALLPLMTTFSGCKASSLDYSLMYFALSFNMNLLSFFTASHWRKVDGGIHAYLKQIHHYLNDRVKTNCRVSSVEKTKDGIVVTLEDKSTYHFDEIIFACQAYIAKDLIKNITHEQLACLSAFEYVDVQSTLHTDIAAVSCQPLSHEYCQFGLTSEPTRSFVGTLTRVNNNLHPYQKLDPTLFVSFDNRESIDASKIIAEKNWKLPKLRPIDMAHKRKIANIQGKGSFWFCGTDYSLTGHEGALVSGLVIADHLGAACPFKVNWLARAQFDVIKSFMGIYTAKEKITEKLVEIIFKTAKFLNLHRRLSSRFVKDLIF